MIGDKPGEFELKEGIPFAGATGNVLRSELQYRGLDLKKMRRMNLWQHPINGNKKCLELGEKKALEEGKNKKIVALIGSNVVKHFCHISVEDYNGLVVPCEYFSGAKVIVMVQPAMAFRSGLGEVRFAMDEFVYLMRQEKLI